MGLGGIIWIRVGRCMFDVCVLGDRYGGFIF